MSLAEMRMIEVDGIRTFHVPRPGRTRAALWFGVGWGDEDFATRGVTHVIEHLAMSATTAGKFERNATVDRTRTVFWASGRVEQVGRFLAEVGDALAHLPVDQLEREKAVLDAECAKISFGPHEIMLTRRFGTGGLGLGCYPGLGPQAVDLPTVMNHLRRWFVRDNAVLTVLGDLPDDLALVLPEGPVPVHDHEAMLLAPGWLAGDLDDPALSFVAEDRVETGLALRAMATRLERTLREERGQVYGVVPDLIRLPGTGRMIVQLATASAPGSAKDVAEALVAELTDRVAHGVSAEEILDDLEWWDAAEEEPESVDWNLDKAAEFVLAGREWRSLEAEREALTAVRPDDVARSLQDVLDTVLLLVPDKVEPTTVLTATNGCAVSDEMTTAPLRRRLRSPAPKGTALGFDSARVQYRDEDGQVHEVGFDECVGVGIGVGPDEGGRLVFGRRGCHVWVHPREYQGASAVVRAIDERVPATLRFEMS